MSILISIIIMNIATFSCGYFTRYAYGEWKLKLIEKNLMQYEEYKFWLEQNRKNLKTPDGKLPEYF